MLLLGHAEGPLSKENPTSAADLRLLCSGQFLDNAKTLKGRILHATSWHGQTVHGSVLESTMLRQLQSSSAPLDMGCLFPCADYHKLMGSPEALAVVTMHVLVRPPQLGKAAGTMTLLAAVLRSSGLQLRQQAST